MTVVAFVRPTPVEAAVRDAPETREESRLRLYGKTLSALFMVLLISCSTLVLVGFTALLCRTRIFVSAGTLGGQMGFAFSSTFDPLAWSSEIQRGFVPVSHLPVWVSTLAAVLLIIRFLPGLMILWYLHRLFSLYAQGSIFTNSHTLQMQRIAYAVLLYSVIRFITHPAMYAIGLAPDIIKYDIQQLDASVLGLILLAVAHVMAIGSRIQQEQEDYI
ncbi:DUF2975 domain-containing protein [Nguyenibacter vanlangensis]|uniref:DUF2975 domain-containing protein n=1 Tax=Nguyenibacter vanlangensis TaxID=1216886 RepID=A0ABZ3DA37_9PROT